LGGCVSTATSAGEKRATVVVDFAGNGRVIYENKMNAKRHPASLTKMMTVYLLFEALRDKRIKLDTKFVTSQLATRQIPSKINLWTGEKISVLDIIKALIVQSANDAAVVAAEGLYGSVKKFCDVMNAKAVSLGMTDTHFENPSGTPNSRQISTARDIMTLGIALYRHFPQFWHFFSLKSFVYRGTTYWAHCKILRWFKEADGGKTGYTCASGFNLFVTANRRDKHNRHKLAKRVFVVVMGFGSGKSRDLYAASLINKYLTQCEALENTHMPPTSKKLMNKYLAQYNVLETTNILPTSKKRISSEKQIKLIENKGRPKKSVCNQAKQRQEQEELVIQEEDEVSIKELLETKKISAKYLDKLYENDEDVIRIEDEVPVGPRR
jgi:D-alanyl-D-alanine carboxypeptidase